MTAYLHGFIPEEQQRLMDQAGVLGSLIYPRIDFSGCKKLLEVGSGVGAQTEVLLRLFPDLEITCVDYSQSQIERAKQNLAFAGDRVSFACQDATKLDLDEKFDSVFICWALEHIPDAYKVLQTIKPYLLPKAKLWFTEVFNSSFYFNPPLPALTKFYAAYNEFQRSLGGNPDIGANLGNLLFQAGYEEIELFHEGFHLDQRQPEDLLKITRYWQELMKSAASGMIEADLITKADTSAMENDLDRIAKDENAVFFYHFVQVSASV
ncbi:Ubiquinone/menaquinone biosynthesis C-methylase UbiE [Algoriphagus locisalis]|uniref:Ubiquinone/menaquinone biosynthesis C-methylase UbiE n=1 Tax=Algoriphagus locisalis TaxID=305507 RepID=A0A1I7DAA6_9BACT|nr:class I SAM-dependent methyltransferase [Algoriphagus locisalis]SFU08555.1 Ubiquinone/menaquinone biosynthesis C-methylase UbiE [Algoriphagus locisalis]